jgi:hypothetical protein
VANDKCAHMYFGEVWLAATGIAMSLELVWELSRLMVHLTSVKESTLSLIFYAHTSVVCSAFASRLHVRVWAQLVEVATTLRGTVVPT